MVQKEMENEQKVFKHFTTNYHGQAYLIFSMFLPIFFRGPNIFRN
jgi:hypothetical protein